MRPHVYALQCSLCVSKVTEVKQSSVSPNVLSFFSLSLSSSLSLFRISTTAVSSAPFTVCCAWLAHPPPAEPLISTNPLLAPFPSRSCRPTVLLFPALLNPHATALRPLSVLLATFSDFPQRTVPTVIASVHSSVSSPPRDCVHLRLCFTQHSRFTTPCALTRRNSLLASFICQAWSIVRGRGRGEQRGEKKGAHYSMHARIALTPLNPWTSSSTHHEPYCSASPAAQCKLNPMPCLALCLRLPIFPLLLLYLANVATTCARLCH